MLDTKQLLNEAHQYISLKAAAASLGMNYITFRKQAIAMGIPLTRFPLDNAKYVLIADVQRIKEMREAAKTRKEATL